jgi:hypothetical protein
MDAKVIQFAAIWRPKMASQSQPTPQQQQTSVTTAAFAQMTQIQPYVPPNVWTTDALMDLHAKQEHIALENIRSLDTQRGREHQLTWGGVLLVAGIIGFGAYLVVIGNLLGKDIIGGTVIFLAGYLAGQGKANLK